MKINILYNSIIDIQKEYLELLKQFKNSSENNALYIIDNIQVFWFSKKEIVEVFLNNFSNNYDTCAFLCGSYINTLDEHHIPFYALGKKHIVDDVVVKISMSSVENSNLEIVKNIAKSLNKAISDNINCIENFPDILILPISFLFDDNKMVKKGADDAFFSLFENKDLTFEEYKNKFSSLDEVFDSLDKKLRDYLYFNDINLSYKDRYYKYARENNFYFAPNDEVLNFYLCTSSLYAQALSIISLCIRFRFYPYIREYMIFSNFMFLFENFKSFAPLKIREFALIHFLFLKIYMEFMLSSNDMKVIRRNDFIGLINSKLNKEGIDINKAGSFAKINELIIEELKILGIFFDKQGYNNYETQKHTN